MMKKLQILQKGSISKMLLLTLTAGLLSVGADAQSRINGTGTKVKAVKNFHLPVEPSTSVSGKNKAAQIQHPTPYANSSAKAMVVGKSDIATSANIYGSLLSESTLLDYNVALDIVSYSNRKAIGILPPVNNSGVLQNHVSYNKGTTWDTTLVLTQNALNIGDSVVNRYPNGVVCNPVGNTIPNNAYAVVAAPMLNSASAWDGGTFASMRLDGANGSSLNILNATATQPQWMPRIGMCAGTNGNVYVAGANYDFEAVDPIPFNGVVVNRGVFNSVNNNFDWTQTNVYHAFSRDPSDNSQNNSTLGNMTFSADGMTGYIVLIGRDSINDYMSPMPIIYRSTDAGTTWSLYAVNDFSSIFTGTLPNNDQGFLRAFWYLNNSMDLSVDAYGKLHILCEVGIASSNHPDSLNFLNAFGTLFDVYEAANGTWNQLLVGQLFTDPDPAPAGGTNTFGWTVGFDGRAQICRSANGYKMSYFWMDTDTIFGALNLYPNIKGSSADFSTLMATDEVNFTEGGSYDASNYWMSVSGQGYDDLTGGTTAPIVTSRLLNVSGVPNADDSTNPWMHEFVSGISFNGTDYVNAFTVGIAELPEIASSISVYPNPAKNLTNLNLDLKAKATVNISIVNNLGQTVKSVTLGNANAGLNTYQLDITNLSNGIYVIQMNISGQVATRLLSIQN